MSTLIIKNSTKKTAYVITAIVIIACLIAAGTFVYFTYYNNKKEDKGTETAVPQFDDRISPLVPQGLIIEINRIRHRGLVDTILQSGTAWKTKPQFYFITNMDGLEYISKDVASAGGAKSEILFNDWDTMFQENKIVRDVKQNQSTSEVTLTIMEREKTGLLKLRHQDVEKEKISLTYDFKTGRWDGDDAWNDIDGYGHYLGENFEIWFNLYQTDYNHDGIPYWTEVNVLHVSPYDDNSKIDPNNDGIPISWDWKWGFNPFANDNHSKMDPDNDGLTNLQEYQMSNYFANPYYKDIYLEVDGMQKGGLLDPAHVFWPESGQIIMERFSAHNISIFIDYGWPGDPTNGGGELLPHIETLSQDSGMMLQFYENHFSDERKGVFRYVVVGHNAGFCHPSKFNMYDTMAVDTSLNKLLLKRKAFTPRTQRIVLASATMHELGHSLGISRWIVEGNDNITFSESKQAKQDYLDEWGNYKSVMNYYYIWDKKIADYSDGSHGTGDFNDWTHMDLTYFKAESEVIEDPSFTFPLPPPD
ncbi:MAG: hypothetical protein NT038_03420 [Euryarchaeota archaeon]|nr:hypothetical protein [Euryarchaeota archaeon]